MGTLNYREVGAFEPGIRKGFMKDKWSEEYDLLLERAIAEGKVQVLPDKEERRGSPRFKFSKELFRSAESIQRDIIDMSTTGFAFHSERTYEIGEEVPLTMHDAFQAHAKVVGCEMVETDSAFLEFKYRVRCQFTNPEHGMIILMLLFEESTATDSKGS